MKRVPRRIPALFLFNSNCTSFQNSGNPRLPVVFNLKLFKMKRNEEIVPGFDEIVFENRNREYGAYDLRKRYNAAAGISIIGSVAICTALLLALSVSSDKGIATAGPTNVLIILDAPEIAEPVSAPPPKPPDAPVDAVHNMKPEVTDDTLKITDFIPTTDDLVNSAVNKGIGDTIVYSEPADPVIPDKTEPRIFVEEMPEYPGGIPELLKFVAANLKYPEEAIAANIEGKVILKFVVNTDGSTDRIEVLRSVDPLLDNEAVRVVKSLPLFRPGKQGGVAVPVWFTIPVVFRLNNN
jgi:protein TonB